MWTSCIDCSDDGPGEKPMAHYHNNNNLLINRAQKLKGAPSITDTTIDPRTANPFTPRPSSGSLTHGTGLVSRPSFEFMAELDSPSYMPEGVESVQWDRLVTARHRKVESEQRASRCCEKLVSFSFLFSGESCCSQAGRYECLSSQEA